MPDQKKKKIKILFPILKFEKKCPTQGTITLISDRSHNIRVFVGYGSEWACARFPWLLNTFCSLRSARLALAILSNLLFRIDELCLEGKFAKCVSVAMLSCRIFWSWMTFLWVWIVRGGLDGVGLKWKAFLCDDRAIVGQFCFTPLVRKRRMTSEKTL